MINSALQFAGGAILALLKHPATGVFARQLVRAGTAQLVRSVRSRTGRRSPSL